MIRNRALGRLACNLNMWSTRQRLQHEMSARNAHIRNQRDRQAQHCNHRHGKLYHSMDIVCLVPIYGIVSSSPLQTGGSSHSPSRRF
jgi:hypothetical protein